MLLMIYASALVTVFVATLYVGNIARTWIRG
jgi:hypothetical protein